MLRSLDQSLNVLEVRRVLNFRVKEQLAIAELVESHPTDELVENIGEGEVVIGGFAQSAGVRKYNDWLVISVLASMFDENVGCFDVAMDCRLGQFNLTFQQTRRLMKHLRKLLLRAQHRLDECFELLLSKVSQVDHLQGVRIVVFDLDKGTLQVHNVICVHEESLSFVLFRLQLTALLLCFVEVVDLRLAKTVKRHDHFDRERLLLLVKLSRVGFENDAIGAKTDQIDIGKVIDDELSCLRVVLQRLHHILQLHFTY